MVRGRSRILVSAGAVAGILALLVLWLTRTEPIPVRVAAIERGSVLDTVANTRAGTIEACRRAGISPRLGGQIDLMPVSEGDVVEAGQLLMAFWNDDLRARARLAESELQASEARREQACIVADRYAREAQRQRRLRTQNLASEEATDNAESQALAQQAMCTAARAAVEVGHAQVEVAEAALDQTQLRAPFPGVVAEVNGEVGEFVTPSPVGIPTPPAVDLMDISCLYVSAPIDEVDAPGIRVGMPANISLDAFSGQVFRGRVRRIAPYVLDVEKQARTVDVEVEFLDPSDCGCMLPGYSADIEVILAQHDDVLRVPTQAIREGDRVFVLDEGGRVTEKQIAVGLRNWVWTEVTDGVVRGETLLLSVDRDGVGPGARVEPDTQPGLDD